MTTQNDISDIKDKIRKHLKTFENKSFPEFHDDDDTSYKMIWRRAITRNGPATSGFKVIRMDGKNYLLRYYQGVFISADLTVENHDVVTLENFFEYLENGFRNAEKYEEFLFNLLTILKQKNPKKLRISPKDRSELTIALVFATFIVPILCIAFTSHHS